MVSRCVGTGMCDDEPGVRVDTEPLDDGGIAADVTIDLDELLEDDED